MVQAWVEPNLFVICFAAIAGGALGLFGLIAPPSLFRRKSWQWTYGIFLVLALAFAGVAFACRQPPELWLPPFLLVVACVLFQLSRSERILGLLGRPARIVESPHGRAVALLVLGPLVALGWWLATESSSDEPGPPLFTVLENSTLPLDEVSEPSTYTDAGRRIRLWRHSAKLADAPPSQLLRSLGLGEQAIPVAPGPQPGNAFGWIFAAGRHALLPEDVEHILTDNRYKPSEKPQKGDVVIYRNPAGKIVHAGVVRSVRQDGIILVQSQWGSLGRFLHPATVGCEGGVTCAYYSADRWGHVLRGLQDPVQVAEFDPDEDDDGWPDDMTIRD